MRPNIHPKYRPIKAILPDGREHTIWSSLAKDELYIDVVWDKHPAWTQSGKVEVSQINENVVKFNSRFGGLNIFGDKKEEK